MIHIWKQTVNRLKKYREEASNARKKTVQSGMVKCISILLAPYILLLVVLNILVFSASVQRVENSQANILRLQAYDIDDQMKAVENSVQRLFGENYYYFLVLAHESDETKTFLSRQELYQQMNRYALASSPQEVLFLFAPETDQFLLEGPDLPFLERERIREFLQPYLAEQNVKLGGQWYIKEIDGKYYLIVFQKMYGVWGGGVVSVASTVEGLLQGQQSFFEKYRLFLSTGNNCYQIEEDGEVLEAPLEKTEISVRAGGPSGAFVLYLEPRSVLILFSEAYFLVILVACSALMVAILPFWMQKISKKLTQPLQDLGAGMQRLQKGKFETKLETEYEFLEMEDIKDIFNEMTRQMKVLKNDVYEEKLLRQKTEFDFLQMQVRPHFYLNCLNQIHILSEMGDSKGVSNLSQCLVRYFRYLLCADGPMVALQDELVHIDDFLNIQKIRYPAGLQYSCKIQEGLQNMRLPPLLLLTFVENSVKYALSIYGESQMSIQAKRVDKSYCHIYIDDNGKGVPNQVLDALNRDTSEEIYTAEGRKCVGIVNARQRLRFAFGDQAHIYLSNNSPLGGCRVEICIPWEEDQT